MDAGNQNMGPWLEVGLAAFSVSLLVGAVLLISGDTKDQTQSRAQKSKGPAAKGEVPSERHQNIATVASR